MVWDASDGVYDLTSISSTVFFTFSRVNLREGQGDD